MQMTRRSFVQRLTVGGLGLAGASLAIGSLQNRAFGQKASPAQPASGEKPLYAFLLFGDTHFDRMAHHDMEWVKKTHPGDVHQIQNYVHVTESYTPDLFAEARQVIAGLGVPVPFAIHVGDLVEGLCGSYELQATQFKDAMGFVDEAKLGVPFLMCKGNHDITGPGAPEAYDKVLLPWLSGQHGQTLTRACYTRRQGDDLFVFFDAYKPDLEFLADALKEKARQVFFVIHPPVVPYDARSNWHIFPTEGEAESRERLLKLLGQSRAIVLSGHLHKYSLLTRKTDAGPFAQLAVCSVLRGKKEVPRRVRDGVEQYTPDLVKLEPSFVPATLEERRKLLEAEAPSIQRYEYCDVPGYAVVKVYADRVDADLYVGLGQDKWRSRELDRRAVPTANT